MNRERAPAPAGVGRNRTPPSEGPHGAGGRWGRARSQLRDRCAGGGRGDRVASSARHLDRSRAGGAKAQATAQAATSGLTPFTTVTGKVYMSEDAIGTNDPAGGPVQVQKRDASATVKAAYRLLPGCRSI